jgi:hypothetical protein
MNGLLAYSRVEHLTESSAGARGPALHSLKLISRGPPSEPLETDHH